MRLTLALCLLASVVAEDAYTENACDVCLSQDSCLTGQEALCSCVGGLCFDTCAAIFGEEEARAYVAGGCVDNDDEIAWPECVRSCGACPTAESGIDPACTSQCSDADLDFVCRQCETIGQPVPGCSADDSETDGDGESDTDAENDGDDENDGRTNMCFKASPDGEDPTVLLTACDGGGAHLQIVAEADPHNHRKTRLHPMHDHNLCLSLTEDKSCELIVEDCAEGYHKRQWWRFRHATGEEGPAGKATTIENFRKAGCITTHSLKEGSRIGYTDCADVRGQDRAQSFEVHALGHDGYIIEALY
jgi:hypothetical protein